MTTTIETQSPSLLIYYHKQVATLPKTHPYKSHSPNRRLNSKHYPALKTTGPRFRNETCVRFVTPAIDSVDVIERYHGILQNLGSGLIENFLDMHESESGCWICTWHDCVRDLMCGSSARDGMMRDDFWSLTEAL